MNAHFGIEGRVLDLMGDNRERTASDVANRLLINIKEAQMVMGKLHRAGAVIKDDNTPSGYPRIYRIASLGGES